jgi:cyclopropane fatty-acyl-phospholipid synthase-like methyltransferase
MPNTVYHYDEKALTTLAILFSPGFTQLGEKPWIEAMGHEFDLTNKKVLLLGSGAGGAACFLASRYDAQVLGLETEPFLIEASQQLKEKAGLHNVTFERLHLPFSNGHKFDLIFSINTLSDYKEKNVLFTELHRILRPNGTLAMLEWFHKSPNYSEDASTFFEYTHDVFYLNTPQDYLQILEKNHFSYVNFNDTTKNMRHLSEELIMQLKTNHQGEIIAAFGAEYYEEWLDYWQLLHAALQSGDLISGSVRGVKVK